LVESRVAFMTRVTCAPAIEHRAPGTAVLAIRERMRAPADPRLRRALGHAGQVRERARLHQQGKTARQLDLRVGLALVDQPGDQRASPCDLIGLDRETRMRPSGAIKPAPVW
jgi:hypothetical protein